MCGSEKTSCKRLSIALSIQSTLPRPTTINWLGQERPQSYAELVRTCPSRRCPARGVLLIAPLRVADRQLPYVAERRLGAATRAACARRRRQREARGRAHALWSLAPGPAQPAQIGFGRQARLFDFCFGSGALLVRERFSAVRPYVPSSACLFHHRRLLEPGRFALLPSLRTAPLHRLGMGLPVGPQGGGGRPAGRTTGTCKCFMSLCVAALYLVVFDLCLLLISRNVKC